MSKTVNLPNDYPYEDFKTLYIKAFQAGFLKGITTYRAGTMMTVLSAVEEKKDKIQYNDAPRRPVSLDCDVFHFSRAGQPYFVLVGLLDDGSPFEVFAGKNNNDAVNKTIKKGKIIKRGRGKYKAEFEDSELSPLKAFIDPSEESMTRLVSSCLRHGMKVSHVVEQLEKDKGDLNSLAKVVVRALKTYLEDGSKVHGVNCPECGGELRRTEGCSACTNCGYSKC